MKRNPIDFLRALMFVNDEHSLFRGFTLIELLVVIAIIGVLSSIVLASLSTARSKANDAKVEEQMSGLRTAAEIYYNSHNGYMITGTYTGGGTGNVAACSNGTGGTGTFANTFLSDIASGAQNVISGIASTSNVGSLQCSLSTTGWVVVANLPSTPSTNPFWCVDNAGHSKGEPAVSSFSATTTTCN